MPYACCPLSALATWYSKEEESELNHEGLNSLIMPVSEFCVVIRADRFAMSHGLVYRDSWKMEQGHILDKSGLVATKPGGSGGISRKGKAPLSRICLLTRAMHPKITALGKSRAIPGASVVCTQQG